MEIEALRDDVRHLNRRLDDLRGEIQGNRATSTIEVNAGGLGVWIAATACIVMLVVTLIGGMVIIDQRREISDLRDYLNAIYQQAPHLKPEQE